MRLRRPRRRATKPPVRQRLKRGAYILPSLFTVGNILLGFYAVVLASRGGDGSFERAVVMILIAAILDALDGRIARMTHTESEFGKEFDSLADVLTFGAAPALMCYFWGLDNYGRIGWLVPLYYLLCAAIRLARFNVQTKTTDSRFFVGMPSPPAAGSVCALIFFSPRPDFWQEYVDPRIVEAGLFAALIFYGSLMVSTFRYPSFKKIDLRQRRSYRTMLFIIAAFLVVIVILDNYPTAFFLMLAFSYTATGVSTWLWGRLRRRPDAPQAAPAASAKASTPEDDA